MAECDVSCKQEQRLTYIENDIKELKLNNKEYSKDINVLRESHAETKIYVKEIKEGIVKISTKIDDIETRPSKLLYSITGGVIVALIMLGINLLGNR